MYKSCAPGSGPQFTAALLYIKYSFVYTLCKYQYLSRAKCPHEDKRDSSTKWNYLDTVCNAQHQSMIAVKTGFT